MSKQSTASDSFKSFIAYLATGQSLSEPQARECFSIIMSGEATEAQIGGFLMAMRVRGETVAEITGAATVMRDKANKIKAPPGAIDTCGTGGDASGTYNISTAAALVAAACGVTVAKHGNKALSSKSGSADVLSALGVNIDAAHEIVELAIADAGIGFLMAPRHHGAMRHVGPARASLGTRTIFNLLGPLSNPAGATRQVIGVFHKTWVRPMAEVLNRLGTEHAWVVHGEDGLDELTTTGTSHVAECKNGIINEFEVSPADAGLPIARMSDLRGGNPQVNAQAIRDLLSGKPSAYRDIVLMNAAAALMVAAKAVDLSDGARQAARAIDSGKGSAKLADLIAITQINT